MITLCMWCNQQMKFTSSKGWVHQDGSQYTMECPDCGWIGAQPAVPLTHATDICPLCKVQGKLRDNHVAMPGKKVPTDKGGNPVCTPGHEGTCYQATSGSCNCQCGGLNHGKGTNL